MLYGDGSGKLATISAVSGSTITVDSYKNIIEGMVIDVIDSDGDTEVATKRIVSIDRSTKVVTMDGSMASASVGSIITVQGSYGKEITGLGALFGSSTTLYGLTRADNKWLTPHKFTSTTITDVVIQKAIDTLDEVAGSQANFIVCSSGVKRAYQNYLATNRSNIDVMNLQGGYTALSYNGIPLISDRFVPEGTMYILNTDDFHLHQLCDWRWLEGDDGRVIRQVAGKPVYTSTLVKYADLICDRPIGQAVITGITEA